MSRPHRRSSSCSPFIENFVDNVALVQFNHRIVAYLIVALALWHAASLHRQAPGSSLYRRASALAGLALAQMALGIGTLLLAVPLWAGLAHQVFAMLVLATAVIHVRRTRAELSTAAPRPSLRLA